MIRAILLLTLAAPTPLWAEVVEAMVSAVAETAPINGDADDPAIWVHPTDPAQSLILGTDKTAGLYVYDLNGTETAFFADGNVNNVDIRPFTLQGELVWLASAAERGAERLVFWVIRADGTMTRAVPFDHAPVPERLADQVDDIYGSAMMRNPETGQVWAFVNYKSGDILQWEILDEGGQLTLKFVRHLKVASQPEGMVADDVAGHLYVGEEDVAIWRFPAWPDAGDTPTLIDRVPSECFPRDDIEGLSIYDGADQRYLVASSQGIHRVALYPLSDTGLPKCVGLVGIDAGDTVDGVTETDGLDVVATPLGDDYPAGMLVIMDDQNELFSTNFKMVSWADIVAALELD